MLETVFEARIAYAAGGWNVQQPGQLNTLGDRVKVKRLGMQHSVKAQDSILSMTETGEASWGGKDTHCVLFYGRRSWEVALPI